MGKYPGYAGSLNPSGDIRIIFQENGMMEVKMYTFRGMEPSVTDAVLNIHFGTTCNDTSLVGPHYWNEDKVSDLWNVEGGAVYDTLATGKPVGGFHMYNGYKAEDNVGHAVVAHGKDGSKIACGILEYFVKL